MVSLKKTAGTSMVVSNEPVLQQEIMVLRQSLAALEQQMHALQQSHDLLISISQQVPGGIYQFQLFPDGRYCIPFVSQSMIDLFEVNPEEVRHDASKLFSRIVPEDLAGLMGSIQDSARTLAPWHREFRERIPTKGVRWLEGNSRPQPQPDGSIIWHGFITDITEKKQIELQFEEGRFQLYDAQRIAHIGSWHWVVASDTVTWTDQLYVITGRSRDLPNIVYADQEQLYTTESWERLDHAVRRSLETGEPYELELDLIRADGVTRKTVARGEVVRDKEGVITQLHGTLQDVTERTQLKQQLYEAKKLESIGQLAAGVAHEVRNPLNAILTVTEALFREPGIENNPGLAQYMKHIRSQVTRLASLMNDLLDLGKPIPAAHLQPVPLAEFCLGTVELWQNSGMAANRQVELEGIQDGASIQVLADSDKLQQVLFNVLENAGHFTPVGRSIRLKLAGSLPSSAETARSMVVIQIIDQGCGIAPDRLTRVFDPFYTNRRGGTGLGLALVKHFMEHMAGMVQISNNDFDSGCTVTLTLPAVPDKGAP